ncbi:MAG: LptF/LptG family permease [Rickettsiales bacterium]|jgi:lipopolysaccharide export system permease protein|nr:LptF/LptG family permease [Rickettsiales bacterium]
MRLKHRILDRFLAAHFFRAFGLVFFCIAGIILLFSIIKSMAATGAQVPFRVVAQLAFLEILRTLTTTLPLSVLLAGSLAFWRLSRSSELTVIRGAGVSVWGFLAPMIGACVLIGILDMTILSPINAAMDTRINKLKYRHSLSRRNPMLFSQNGLWLKEKTDLTQSFLYAGRVVKEGQTLKAENVSIFTTDLESNFLRRIEARSATLENHSLQMTDVKMIDPQLREESFATYEYPTSLSGEKIEENSSEPDAFSFWELPGFIKFFEASGFSAKNHRLYFYTLLFMPLILSAMLFISALFSISPSRDQKNLVLKLSAGVMIGFGAFFLDQIVRAMGAAGRLPLLGSSLLVPITVILTCATVFLYREDG